MSFIASFCTVGWTIDAVRLVFICFPKDRLKIIECTNMKRMIVILKKHYQQSNLKLVACRDDDET